MNFTIVYEFWSIAWRFFWRRWYLSRDRCGVCKSCFCIFGAVFTSVKIGVSYAILYKIEQFCYSMDSCAEVSTDQDRAIGYFKRFSSILTKYHSRLRRGAGGIMLGHYSIDASPEGGGGFMLFAKPVVEVGCNPCLGWMHSRRLRMPRHKKAIKGGIASV